MGIDLVLYSFSYCLSLPLCTIVSLLFIWFFLYGWFDCTISTSVYSVKHTIMNNEGGNRALVTANIPLFVRKDYENRGQKKDGCYLGRYLNGYLLNRPVGHNPYWLNQAARLFM